MTGQPEIGRTSAISYKQIADVLGVSETNVGARLSRTKAKLQDLVRQLR